MAFENAVEGPRPVKKVRRADAVALGRDLLDRVGLAATADAYPAQLSAASSNA